MNRFIEIKNTMKHRKVVQKIAKAHGYSFPFHDFLKMINIAIFGDKIATKIHRKFSGHHAHTKYLRIIYDNGFRTYTKKQPAYRYIKHKIEAAIDWESARFTKPEKPLNAYETWKKYYNDIDMEAELKELGFWQKTTDTPNIEPSDYF